MAVKKLNKADNVVEKQEVPEVEVDTTAVTGDAPVEAEENQNEEIEKETPQEDCEECKVPATEEKKEEEVEVDTSAVAVDVQASQEKTVRIKTRVDHKCTIGGELYNLKAGKCYNVPVSVKYILNNAGLLAPL